MTDRYLELSHTGWGKAFSSMLGLPMPPRLRRGSGPWAAQPLEGRAVLVGASGDAKLCPEMLRALQETGALLRIRPELPGLSGLKSAAASFKIALAGAPVAGEEAEPNYALVFDASDLARPEQLREVYDFFQPQLGKLVANGRVVVISRTPAAAGTASAAAAAASLQGFVRSLAKEQGRKGRTVNLIEVGEGAEETLVGALRFLLSEHSAFVSGQVLTLTAPPDRLSSPQSWVLPLKGKTALVTGAARGIGAAIAQVLAREGAQVVGVDRPPEEGHLAETMSRIQGVGLAADITAADAGDKIARECAKRFGGLDIVVHNAGITRDKMLHNMPPHFWDQVLDVNLAAILRLNEKLSMEGLKAGARMVCVSSLNGIAGAAGQTNYAASKAGIIGYVQALAPEMAKRGGAINAVAPGFIETQMTAAMPLVPREVGRRLNSLSQGGLPEDIAEAVAFLASPYAAGVNGRTLRVCGQNWVGA